MTMDEDRLVKRKQRAKREGETRVLAEIIRELGDRYYQMGKLNEALQEYFEQREVCHVLNDRLNYAIANRMIGDVYIGLGNLDHALTHHKIYLEVSQEVGNLLEEQRAWATLGRTHFLLSESFVDDTVGRGEALDSAKKAYQKSIKICNRWQELNITLEEVIMMRARLLLNWGLVYEAEGDLDKAIEFYENAAALCTKHGLHEELHRIHLTLSAANERREKYENALAHLEKATSVNDPILQADARIAKAELFLRMGNWQDARRTLVPLYLTKGLSRDKSEQIKKYLRIAVSLCAAEDDLTTKADPLERLQVYEELGDAAVAACCLRKAVEYYRGMLSCAEASGSDRVGPALVSLARTLKEAGHPEEALIYARRELQLCTDPREVGASALFSMKLSISAKAEEREIGGHYDTALTNARISGDTRLELAVIEEYLLYLRSRAGCSPSEISKLEERINDIKDSLSDSDENDEEADSAPAVGADIRLDDLPDVKNERRRVTDRPKRAVAQGFQMKRNAKGETQLHVACIEGNVESVRRLIRMGHSTNVRDNCGWTPLHEAANHDHTEIAEILIRNGANVNDPGGARCDGITPLLDAASCGNFGTMRLLIKHGADPNLRSAGGKTPLDMLDEWKERAGPLATHLETEYTSIRAELSLILKESRAKLKESVGNNDCGKRASKAGSIGAAAEDYKRVMDLLRDRGMSGEANRASAHAEADLPALLDTDDVVDDDDWLENDVKVITHGTAQRRSVRETDGPSVSVRRHRAPVLVREKSTKRKRSLTDTGGGGDGDGDGDGDNDNDDDGVERVSCSSDSVDNFADSDTSEALSGKEAVGNSQRKRRRERRGQTSLLSVGFTKDSISRTPSPRPTTLVNNRECTSKDTSEKLINLRVVLEERMYNFQVGGTECGRKTVAEVMSDIEKQFYGETGCNVKFTLQTTDGQPLSSECSWDTMKQFGDPTVLLCDPYHIGVSPAVERYKTICRTFSAPTYESVIKCLKSCENTSVFRLDSEAVNAAVQPTHLLRTLEYQKILRVLSLSGVSLYNHGELLSRCLARLISLQELFLRECDISPECLGEIQCLPEQLRVLDLGYNPLTARSLDALYKLLKAGKHLQALDLRSCQLSEFSIPFDTNSIVNLDLSWNPLRSDKVQPSFERHLLQLNLSYTIDSSGCSPRRNILENHAGDSFVNLESLEFASCGITDLDVSQILPWLPNLTRLVIKANRRVTVLSVNLLLEREPTLSYIDASGCTEIMVPPHPRVRIKKPETCTLITSMTRQVCESWLSLWQTKGSVDQLPHNVVIFKPVHIHTSTVE